MSTVARGSHKLLIGDCRATLATLPAGSVHCAITSPPYWNLRAYLDDSHPDKQSELGCETTPAEYVAKMVAVFEEVRRVLHPTGTLWLNVGDSYAAAPKNRTPAQATRNSTLSGSLQTQGGILKQRNKVAGGLKQKDLVGIPWRLALALQDAGWYLRQDIIWHKPSAMPSSVQDRCTTAHEYLFLLSKSPRYFYDVEAVKEPAAGGHKGSKFNSGKTGVYQIRSSGKPREEATTRNRRSVWRIPTVRSSEKHYAMFPPMLVYPCVLASASERGCCPHCLTPWKRVTQRTVIERERPNSRTDRHEQGNGVNACRNDQAGVRVETLGWQQSCKCEAAEPIPCTVLDPFAGTATTGMVATNLGRDFIGCELNPAYAEIAEKRIAQPWQPKGEKKPKTPRPAAPSQRVLF